MPQLPDLSAAFAELRVNSELPPPTVPEVIIYDSWAGAAVATCARTALTPKPVFAGMVACGGAAMPVYEDTGTQLARLLADPATYTYPTDDFSFAAFRAGEPDALSASLMVADLAARTPAERSDLV